MLHSIKVWLTAPVVVRHHVRAKTVQSGHESEPMPRNVSAAPNFLARSKTWLSAPVSLGRQVHVENTKNGHEAESIPIGTSTAALVLHVCWLSIFVGLVIQLSLLAVSVAFGRFPKLNPLIVDFAQRIAWSTIVCASISVAMAASKLPVSLKGISGVLSASVAFKIARSVQKGVGAALGAAPAVVKGPSPLVLGIIKAVEYGCLAAILAWMVKRKHRGAKAHAAIGLTMGIFFGAIVLGYTYWTNIKLFTAADATSRGLNEIFFPVGCSLVLFATEVWAKQWKSADEHKAGRPLAAERTESVP
jgi:hypothetical protein